MNSIENKRITPEKKSSEINNEIKAVSIFGRNNLTRTLEARGCTVEDIKTDALMALVHNLLKQFIHAEENNLSESLLKDDNNIKRKELILNTCRDIYNYLDNKKDFFSYEKMNLILEKGTSIPGMYVLGVGIEPITYFYDIMVIEYKKFFKNLLKEKKSQSAWMPELLAISLITDLITAAKPYSNGNTNMYSGYTLKNYNYLKDYDFSDVLLAYEEFSKTINKVNKISYKAPIQDKNLIAKSMYISLGILKKLNNTKYKAPIHKVSRVSKTRKKKKSK